MSTPGELLEALGREARARFGAGGETPTRVFRGRSVDELVPQIQRELGSDAIIVRRREGLTGGVLGFFQRAFVEIEAMPGAPGVDLYDEAASAAPAPQPPVLPAPAAPVPQPPAAPASAAAVQPPSGRPRRRTSPRRHALPTPQPPPSRRRPPAVARRDAVCPVAARRRAAARRPARRPRPGPPVAPDAVLRARDRRAWRRRRQRVRDRASGRAGACRPHEARLAAACAARARRRRGALERRLPGAATDRRVRALSAGVGAIP